MLHFGGAVKYTLYTLGSKDVKRFKKLPNSRVRCELKIGKKTKMQEYYVKQIKLLNTPWENSVWRQRESVQWNNERKNTRPFFFRVIWDFLHHTLLQNTGEQTPYIQWVERQRKKEVEAFVAVSADERGGWKDPNKTTAKETLGLFIYFPFMVCPFCSEFLDLFCVAECLWCGPIYIIIGPVF